MPDTGEGVFFIIGHGAEEPAAVQQHLCVGDVHAFPTAGAAANRTKAVKRPIQRRILYSLPEVYQEFDPKTAILPRKTEPLSR